MSVLLWVYAFIFWMIETRYYGWNWSAKSDAEMICDGIATLLFALAGIGTILQDRRP